MTQWETGVQLGPYDLLAPIGVGGMGEVWKARDTRLDRIVAIKRLKAENTERFKREARAIAALNHPHICQIYDVGSDYLVMEFVEGEPLKSPLPPDEAVRLAIQIAEALEAAHEKGIVHRDLKPGNILLTAKGAVKLLDFGLAKMEDPHPRSNLLSTLTDGLTEPGLVVGTVAYMSPEQAQGQPVDARSDIFSFGLVLYEMLSGRRAFGGDTPIATILSIVRDEPAGLRAPATLERIVTRCLRKSRSERFQTMTEVKVALEQPAGSWLNLPPSIAVLPFANMSRDPDDEYFSDGLAEEIINALTQVPDLKVIARTSAFAFKGQNTDVRRVAEALGVTSILEGSVRKAGNRIRVTAQLITASDGSHLWSQRYDRELEDVFAVQDEIATAIAGALKVKLAVAPRRYTPTLAAYEAFLKARHYLQKWTPEALGRGKQCYMQAIEIDPQFALAHCALGEHYFTLASENLIPAQEAVARMRAEAERALEIDSSMAEAHAVLALVSVIDFDWHEAGRQFQMAMSGEHVSPLVRYFYSTFYLFPLGRLKEALEQIEIGLREDPLNLLLSLSPGLCLLGSDDPAGSAKLRQVLELNENAWIPMIWLAVDCFRQGRADEALALAERANSLVPANWGVTGTLAGILSRTGDNDRANSLRGTLGSGEVFGTPAGLTNFHMLRGEIDLAAGWFAKAIEQRDARAPWILPHMFGNQLTSSSYWPALARMMNLPANAS
jgi:eukaryotic-like serine/threonine-protein kinase